MELKLVVLAGAKQGLEIPLKKDKFLIGRAKECSLRAGSEAISRRHCALLRRGDRWTARDLGSRNGTYVNDKRIEKEVPLNPGDELRVGPLKFRIASRGPSAAPAAAKPEASSPPVAQSRKQPPVKGVADVVDRSSKSSGSMTEDDVTRWLLGDTETGAELKETLTFRLEETKTLSRSALNETADTVAEEESSEEESSEAEAGPEDAEAEGEGAAEKAGGWGLFKRGKGAAPKKKPGKLPPRPEQQSKSSGEAAADILREMTRRR